MTFAFGPGQAPAFPPLVALVGICRQRPDRHHLGLVDTTGGVYVHAHLSFFARNSLLKLDHFHSALAYLEFKYGHSHIVKLPKHESANLT